MSTLPPVSVDLSDFQHPLSDREWVYGPRRTDWIGGHPIVAVGDPEAGEPMIEFRGPLGLHRDQLPHVAAFILAVYAATEPPAATGPGSCACGGSLPEFTHAHGAAAHSDGFAPILVLPIHTGGAA